MANRTATAEERLIEQYIEIDPRRRSADWARIKGYGMNVWALIGALGGDEVSPAIAEVAPTDGKSLHPREELEGLGGAAAGVAGTS